MGKNCCAEKDSARLNKVGGQAVLEGVMMKAGKKTVTTCRKENGEIVVYDEEFVSVRQKNKLLNLPIIRGVVNFIEMMILSMKTLNASADALGIEEEDGKFEKWCKKHFGKSATDVIMVISLILGLGLSVLLFLFLPSWCADGLNWLWINVFHKDAFSPSIIAVIEGFMKVAIFITYLLLVSMMKDIKRTFMYHGAEHKSIACFEAGVELTPENAKKYSRFHPRCGTSFMFFMILLGIFAGLIIKTLLPNLGIWVYTVIRLLILPLLMGIGYEIIRFAGKHPNFITRAISAPGLWVQRITTKEPTVDMLEVAIVSLKCALRDDYPEFKEFFENRPWEPKAEPENDENGDCANDESHSSEETEDAKAAEETVENDA